MTHPLEHGCWSPASSRGHTASKAWAVAVALLAGVTAGCGTAPPLEPARTEPGSSQVIRDSLPSVVLIVASLQGQNTRFGAGFFDDLGRVVTAQHVVAGAERVSIMVHRVGRPTYTPMDGGLRRFLFENTRELVPATVVKEDGVSDLALLEVTADVGPRKALPWAQAEAHPGDRVLALGHPQETPWSFSEGVVGALQYGIIQHDATVGPGSSGGPLLNTRGEVVGVNVAQVVSLPVGLSFARPAEVVAKVLREGGASSIIDLSSPTSAALSCWRAQELALPDVADCFDWDNEWQQNVALFEEAVSYLDADQRARLKTCAGPMAERERWIEKRRHHVTRALDPAYRRNNSKSPEPDPNDPALPPAVGDLLREGLAEWKSEPADKSMAADFRDPARLRQRLRLGLRVEDSRRVAPDMEWILLGSPDVDGNVSNFSELYVRVGGRWVQRGLPWPEDVSRLPRGWPAPLESYALQRKFSLAWLVKRAKSDEPCEAAPEAEKKKKDVGGT